MATSLVVHGHFYQPPRENPWTGVLERQPSAHPDHDWNARIHRECYRPNAFARIFGEFQQIDAIVNNYAYVSFNIGPTLLSWIEANDPDTYFRILEADRQSLHRLGHGNAIAQAYNHSILPLCNERDRVTQVRWGIAEFRHRFGRDPESMWLPETACDDATLGTLIDHGLSYVVLSPYQAARVRPLDPAGARGHSGWSEVADGSVDPGRAYRYFHRDGSGRSLAIFFYDGPVSRSVAFEGSLASSQAFVRRLASAGPGEGRLIHIATDGESYGHHSHFGDLALAHALLHEAGPAGLEVTNYATYLESHPPTMEAEVKPGPDGEGTAWSCAHGVGRWIRDCGCSTGAQAGWNQAWRGPLRAALDFLRDHAVTLFESEGRALFDDPWAARDAYIELVLDRDRSRDEWLRTWAPRAADARARERAFILLEIQRDAMLMYTSCGWFFSDLSGIETVQVLKYAGRVLDLLDGLGVASPRAEFLELLAAARSNLSEHGSGADIFRAQVDPMRVSSVRVAAHVGIMGLVDDNDAQGETSGYRFRRSAIKKQRQGRIALSTARIELFELLTGRKSDFAIAAMHMGGVDFYCACRPFSDEKSLDEASQRLWSRFRTATLPQLLHLTDHEFGPHVFGLESLLQDGQHRISKLVHGTIVARFSEQFVAMFESNQRIFDMLQEAGLDLPEELLKAAEFTLGRRFEDEIARAHGSYDPEAYKKAIEIAGEAARRGYKLDAQRAGRIFGRTLAASVSAALAEPSAKRFAAATALAQLSERLGQRPNLTRAQELVFGAFSTHDNWLEGLRPLAVAVHVRPPR